MAPTGRGKRSRPNVYRAESALDGWEFIQETILSHDEDMIADFADDIDTLLVFAGLFSAVLTAFLVVSMVLLQPDNSQLSVRLLALIALQNGAPLSIQPFLNATAEALPSTTTVQAPTNAVTINALWFVSLVLSLMTALLGILAKQWCREYLRWHSVIAAARENVLVRQLRFDAWHRWRVPSCIAFIPAFLEIALVLFLVGLLIFVPTFSDRSLTIVVSVVIASGLLAVVALTLLPVFSRLCPYQTPTGWAFVRLAGALHRAFWELARMTSNALDSFFDTFGYAYEPNWSISLWRHSRTMLSSLENLSNWRTYTLYQATHPLFCKAVVRGINTIDIGSSLSSDQAAVDASQTRVLVNALSWVRHGSNDKTFLDKIFTCLQSIHNMDATAQAIHEKSFFLSALHTMCEADLSRAREFVQSFFHVSQGSLSFHIGPPIALVSRDGPYLNIAHAEEFTQQHFEACSGWESNPVSLEICHALVRFDILSLVDDWIAANSVSDEPVRKLVAQRIALLLCLLRIIPSWGVAHGVRVVGKGLAKPWAETLQEMFRRLSAHRMAYFDGLIPMCVELCQFLGAVTLQREQLELSIVVDTNMLQDPGHFLRYAHRECNSVSSWAMLAVEVHMKSQDYEDENLRHLFVISVTHVFDTIRLRVIDGEPVLDSRSGAVAPLHELLMVMIHATGWSLAHSYPDCGAYTPLPWISSMRRCYEPLVRPLAQLPAYNVYNVIPFTSDVTMRSTFLLMLSLLRACMGHRLLTGEDTAEEFEQLLTHLGHPELPEAPSGLELSPSSSPVATPGSLDDLHLESEVAIPSSSAPILASSPSQESTVWHAVEDVASVTGFPPAPMSEHPETTASLHALPEELGNVDPIHHPSQELEQSSVRPSGASSGPHESLEALSDPAILDPM